jgi:putative ABC transport system permease protein
MNEEPAALIYLPQLQHSTRRRFLAVRATAEPLSLTASVQQALWSVDRTLPITAVRTMNQVISESLAPWSGGTAGLAALGLAALLLAALGIYGVISYSVSQRTHELGIRIALGARRRDILTLVLRQGLLLAGIGVAVGVLAAAGLTRLIQALLYGIGALDPWTFIGLPLGLLGIALLASYLPARRATRVDPMTALRYE